MKLLKSLNYNLKNEKYLLKLLYFFIKDLIFVYNTNKNQYIIIYKFAYVVFYNKINKK